MSINDMMDGQQASISSIISPPHLKRRLMDMGFTKGTKIKIVNFAPMNDPIIVRLRGYNVCIRREEASGIEVEECTEITGCKRCKRRRGRRNRVMAKW